MAEEKYRYMLVHDDHVLWHRVKIMVAARKTTIKAVLIKALEEAVDKFEEEVDL